MVMDGFEGFEPTSKK